MQEPIESQEKNKPNRPIVSGYRYIHHYSILMVLIGVNIQKSLTWCYYYYIYVTIGVIKRDFLCTYLMDT